MKWHPVTSRAISAWPCGLVFVTITPIITAMCVVFFIMNFVVWRYHVIYVYERTYEAEGVL
jgi:hypothetical protein